MTVPDMLTMFKVTAQAKGLDTFRFISDDDICVYINQAIANKVRSVVAQTAIMQYPGKSYINDNSISGTNILKNLHKVVSGDIEEENVDTSEQTVDVTDKFFTEIVMFITAVDIAYGDGKEVVSGRLVDPDKFYLLDDDYCNKASWRNPIVTYLKEVSNDGEDYKFMIMYGSREFPTAKTPSKLFIHYISTPSKISSEDTGDYYDIPDYAMPEIIEIAVMSYFKSVGATSQQLEQIRNKEEDD